MHKIKKRNCIDSNDDIGRWRPLTLIKTISLDGISDEESKELFKFDEKFEEESISLLLKQLEAMNAEMDFRVLHDCPPFQTKIIWREGIPFRYLVYSELWDNSVRHLIEVWFCNADDEFEKSKSLYRRLLK